MEVVYAKEGDPEPYCRFDTVVKAVIIHDDRSNKSSWQVCSYVFFFLKKLFVLNFCILNNVVKVFLVKLFFQTICQLEARYIIMQI